MRVAITGEKGFLGTHLTQYFKYVLKYEVIELGRDYFEKLSKTNTIDWLIHGAFVHRNPDPDKVITLNKQLMDATISSLSKLKTKPNVLFLSSIHEDLDTPYGISKREAIQTLKAFCVLNNKKCISLKLPNIFGAYAKPYRTSFIATFCYNLYNKIDINYNQNNVKLCFIDDVLKVIGSFSEKKILAIDIRVDEVYALLKQFNDDRLANKFTPLTSKLEADLYNTYKKYETYKI